MVTFRQLLRSQFKYSKDFAKLANFYVFSGKKYEET